MEWPWERVRRRRDERKLSYALIAIGMAEDGYTNTSPALVARLMRRPFRAHPSFPDATTELDAIWNEAMSLPRWQDAQTTRENGWQKLRQSDMYRPRYTADGQRKISRKSHRDLDGLATDLEQSGDHAAAERIRTLKRAPEIE